MFERDKADLRNRDIPIETKPVDVVFDDELGYIIDRRTALLPPISLTSGEQVLVTLASRLWSDSQLGLSARAAARRLGSITRAEDLPDVRLAIGQSDVDAAVDAIHERRVVEFRYRSKSSGQEATRQVEPWRLFCTAGAWYLVGFDVERGEARVFRLSRIVAGLNVTSQVATQPVPPDLDVAALVASWQELASQPVTAELVVDAGTCAHLRARADTVVPGPEGDVVTISTDYLPALARDVAATAAHVTIRQPAELRAMVAEMVRAASER
jgi:proteasome accessory factor B